MHVIGLTGGICSGKSTIGKIMRERGIIVLDADVLGHRVYDEKGDTMKQVVQEFGRDVLAPNGTIDRAILGSKVFGFPERLARLSSIVWPAIARLASAELEKARRDGHKSVVLEASVLIEAGWTTLVNEVWVSVKVGDLLCDLTLSIFSSLLLHPLL